MNERKDNLAMNDDSSSAQLRHGGRKSSATVGLAREDLIALEIIDEYDEYVEGR